MNNRIETGTEHGVEWKVDSTKRDKRFPVTVSCCFNNNTGIIRQEVML